MWILSTIQKQTDQVKDEKYKSLYAPFHNVVRHTTNLSVPVTKTSTLSKHTWSAVVPKDYIAAHLSPAAAALSLNTWISFKSCCPH